VTPALTAIDLMGRGGSLALLALWSWLLIRDNRRALAPRMAVVMNGGIAAHIIATAPFPVENIVVEAVLQLASGLTVPFFWLFARAWFDDETRIGWRSWAMIAAFALNLGIVMASFEAQSLLFDVSLAIFRTGMFAFAGAGLWIAWKGRDGDLVEARRLLRARLVGAVGGFVIVTNLIEMLSYGGIIPGASRSLIELGILVLAFGFCATMFGFRQPDLFGAPPKRQSGANPANDGHDPSADRLRAWMEQQKPYRDETGISPAPHHQRAIEISQLCLVPQQLSSRRSESGADRSDAK
jgi:hypothetical protein